MSVSSIYTGGSNSENPSFAKAQEAERAAEERVRLAQERIQRAEEEETLAIDQLRDRFEKSYEAQSVKQSEILEEQKSKGYDQIRQLQRAHQSDLNRTIREQMDTQEKLRQQSGEYLNRLRKQSESEVNVVLNERNRLLEIEKAKAAADLEGIHNRTSQSIDQARQISEQRVQQVERENQNALHQMIDSSIEQKEKAVAQNDAFLKKTLQENRQNIEEIYSKSINSLNEIRRDTAQKLAAYSSRQSDPFYKMISIHAELSEGEDEYILRATIPEYEQQNISATVRGNQLVLSGYRKNEEVLKEDSGHSQSTHSYQSFQEAFPLNWPVDAKRLTRETDGDEVTIRVPKLNAFAFKEPALSKPKLDSLQAPDFPRNIRKPT